MANFKHGERNTRLYHIWRSMKSRTGNPNHAAWANYGGRGIEVCEEWKDDFAAFSSWAKANGYADHLTLDRKDNDGGYCPENCRWATYKEQQDNKRPDPRQKLSRDQVRAIIESDGTNVTIALRYGIHETTVSRIKRGLRATRRAA